MTSFEKRNWYTESPAQSSSSTSPIWSSAIRSASWLQWMSETMPIFMPSVSPKLGDPTSQPVSTYWESSALTDWSTIDFHNATKGGIDGDLYSPQHPDGRRAQDPEGTAGAATGSQSRDRGD